jgi:hypothetical protein
MFDCMCVEFVPFDDVMVFIIPFVNDIVGYYYYYYYYYYYLMVFSRPT